MDKLKAMTIFATIVEEGSMSAAARRLGIANSVVSKNLNELESWLGRTLLYRSTRSMNLSPDGRVYLDQIKSIVDKVTDMETPDEILDKDLTGTIHITAPAIIGQRILAPLLPEFHSSWPGINISIHFKDDFVGLIEEGMDLAIRISRLPDSNFIARKLGETRLKLVASPNYIKDFGVPSRPEKLNSHQCLIDNSVSNSRRWSFTDKSGGMIRVPVAGPIEANDAKTLLMMCESGMGFALLPSLFVNDAIKSGLLIEILPDSSTILDISLLYHRGATKTPHLKLLVDHLIKYTNSNHFQ